MGDIRKLKELRERATLFFEKNCRSTKCSECKHSDERPCPYGALLIEAHEAHERFKQSIVRDCLRDTLGIVESYLLENAETADDVVQLEELVEYKREMDSIDRLKAENAKLWEAVNYLYGFAKTLGVDADDLRELGVEVD